ncbi:MAG: RNA-binding protein, partial [Pseudobutyrivibrio sp.]|nr:RNA-binding protein [Pseudobutyrivibrio sp.]
MKLGEIQKLKIQKKVEFGVYLTDGEERVLLPKKQVPENAAISDELSVFVYKDSKDRLIATTTVPLLTLGQMGVLTVSQVNKVGAFLDWGLEKDLLLPFKEMTKQPSEGDEI